MPTGAAGAPSPKAATGGPGDAGLDAESAKAQAASAAAKVQSRYRLDEGFFAGVLAVPKVRGTPTALQHCNTCNTATHYCSNSRVTRVTCNTLPCPKGQRLFTTLLTHYRAPRASASSQHC